MTLNKFLAISREVRKVLICEYCYEDRVWDMVGENKSWEDMMISVSAICVLDMGITDFNVDYFLKPEFAESEVRSWFLTPEGIIICLGMKEEESKED